MFCCCRYQFDCNKWLSLDDGDGNVGYMLTAREVTEVRPKGMTDILIHKVLEDNLWVSVLCRYAANHFSRVQRFSCCYALLPLTMIANAMFFGKNRSFKGDAGWIIDLHFVKVTFLMVYTSVVSVLITLPIHQLTVGLFKKAKKDVPPHQKSRCFLLTMGINFLIKMGLRTKPSTSLDDIEMVPVSVEPSNSRYNDHKQSDLDAEYIRSPCSRISLALGWLLVFLSCVVPSFFLILYSIEWGKKKSEDWLATFFISFTEGLCLLDPVKASTSSKLETESWGQFRRINVLHSHHWLKQLFLNVS